MSGPQAVFSFITLFETKFLSGIGVNNETMLSALNAGSFSSSISPISGGGGTLYASICQVTQCDEKEQMVYYKKQFMASPIFLVVMTILSSVGFFKIIP